MKTKQNFKTYLITLTVLAILCLSSNKSFGQCSEFTLTELEKMSTLNYSNLEIFVAKKNYKIIGDENSSSAIATCNLSINNLLTVNLEKNIEISGISKAYANKLIMQLKTKHYKFDNTILDSGEKKSLYFNSSYYVFITEKENKDFIISLSNRLSKTETDNNDETEQSEEKITAKKLTTNRYEINSYSNSTDISIKKGSKIIITASGSVTYGAWAGSGGPDGIDGYTNYNQIQGFRHGSLLVRIGDNGEWEAVGTSKSILAKNSGVLQFIVNDGDPSNNSGAFIVDLKITKSK